MSGTPMKKLLDWLSGDGWEVRFVPADGRDVECVLERRRDWVSVTNVGAKLALEGAVSEARFRDILPPPPWERSIGEELG